MRRYFAGPKRLRNFQILALIFLVIVSSAAMFLYYENYEVSEKLVVEQVMNQQLVLSRAAATSIEWFFKSLEFEIEEMNKMPALQSHDLAASQNVFSTFIQKYQSQPFLVIALYDEYAKVLLVENKLGIKSAVGQYFPDREYYKWAKDPNNRGKVQISDPFVSRAGMTNGKMVVTLATPLYNKEQFKGLILIISDLEGFTGEFVDPLRVNGFNQAFIVDHSNTIVGSEINSKLIGRNLKSIASSSGWINSKEFISILDKIQMNNEGTLEWLSAYSDSSSVENLITYRHFSVGDKRWMIVMNTSKEAVRSLLLPFLPFELISLFLIVSCTFLSGIIFIITRNTSRLIGFKSGLHHSKSS